MSTQIDESLYSRQLYAIGKDTMTSIINAKLLIINLDPLAVEICKNIILCGVGSITLADNNTISEKDYNNYYISSKDFGKKRAELIGCRLQELNYNVKITKYSGEINTKLLSKFNLVVFVDCPFNSFYKELNKFCHNNNIKNIFASSRGFVGYIFCDFGNFITTDPNGEKLRSAHIINSDNCICTTDKYHDMDIGSQFKFINSNESNKVYEIKKILGHYKFETNIPVTDVGEYIEVKQSQQIVFKSLEESIKEPEFVFIDYADFDMPSKLHKINCAILEDKLDTLKEDAFTKKIINSYEGQLVPVNSIIGGLVANMVISAVSHKYTPIKQWLYYECANIVEPVFDFYYKSNKIYTNQVKVIGNELQKKLNDYKVFIVGSGAIGCEHIKNFSMMGVGNQIITDMDTIEKSNLSRQFLFRNSDIGKSKAEVASKKAKHMNDNINIQYKLNKMGQDTEHIFNKDFYQNIDCVVNALDNVNARIYMDNQAILYGKPLLESGTLGLKGNTQVILPNITETYQSTTDKTEDFIPICTLKNFPYEISHCVQWGREQFESLFVIPFKIYNELKSLSSEKLLEKLNKTMLNELYDIKMNFEYIKENPYDMYKTFYNENFRQKIYDLINQYPEEHITDEGETFWSGTKLFPKILDFTNDNEHCILNMDSFIKIMDQIYNQENICSYDLINTKLINTKLINTKLINTKLINTKLIKRNSKNSLTEEEDKLNKEKELSDLNAEEIKKFIINFVTKTSMTFNEIEFEKDDDTNGHIKFITSLSNLRATNYSIKTVSEFEAKGIAGKIIPALATTTSIVSGLVAIELYKLISHKEYKVENFKNSFLSLGMSFMGSSEPVPCKFKKIGNLKISDWTSLEYNDMSIESLINILNKEYNINIDQIIYNDKPIYSTFTNENKKKEIITKKISEICNVINKSECYNLIISISDIDDDENEEIININIIA
jgi:ubiquitin-activating enzyme E1